MRLFLYPKGGIDLDIKLGDLILVRGNEGLSYEIEWITRSPYSHVAGVVKPNELIEAQAFRKTGYQALDYYAGCADLFTCDAATDEQRLQMVANIERFIGSHYSYLLIGWELIRYAFGVMLMPKKSWDPIICSTLWVVEGYRHVGIDLCPGIRFPSPADIANSNLLRKISSY
jgi:hypothetical protein